MLFPRPHGIYGLELSQDLTIGFARLESGREISAAAVPLGVIVNKKLFQATGLDEIDKAVSRERKGED